jgi:hypothetical protein
MKTIALILHLASYMPPIGSHPQDPARTLTAGTATIVIAACTPGDTVTIGPGNYRSFVPEDGTVVLKVPAQAEGDDPYLLQDRSGTHALHGIAYADQMLTGVCS